MTDPPKLNPPSPVSILLQGLGMTRDDLMRHAVQMKNFLETENSLRAMSSQNDAVVPQEPKTRPGGRSRTTSISNRPSTLLRDVSPPVTPVKAEPVERGLPRQMDTMEMIMERKDRQKRRERRESASRSKDSRRVECPEITSPTTPQTTISTPHHYRYYSERVMEEASGSKTTPDPFVLSTAYMETPTRRTPRPHTVFKAPQTPSRFPKTPTSRQAFTHEPTSSRASSPMSSPARIVNLVSSPGPMRPISQLEEHPDDLPYTLPDGPYSREKPEYSYAAIIGQAILSSPEHRLALQDIYEWITTVYPYYQRGEQTWMNSVRHALSTMAVFRKVPRTRMEGKSLWAIFEDDLPCFAGGGFRKSLCADMAKPKNDPASKPGPKKRGTMEEAMSRNAKRRKTVARDFYGNPVPPLMSGPVMQPFYSQVHPGTHHQPYYGAYMTAPSLPAEVVFPPLPPSSNYHHLAAMKAASASVSSRSTSVSASSVAPSVSTSSYDDVPSSHEPSPAPSSSIASSVPELTPDEGSSSSPPAPDAPFDEPDVKMELLAEPLAEPTVLDPDEVFENWLANDPMDDAVAPHMTLLRGFDGKTSPERASKRSGKLPALPVPTSPTLERRSAAKQKAAAKNSATSLTTLVSQRASSSREMLRPSTPPARPRTPRKRPASRSPQSSPQRTPMSYSRSRSHRSPSPSSRDNNVLPVMPSPDLMRTPSRKRVSSGTGPGSGSGPGKTPPGFFTFSPFNPMTPTRRLFGDHISPFSTPQSARRLFNPHDPATLLDDELARLNSQNNTQGSPSGLYGKAGKGLLYESPGFPSPSQWDKFTW